MDGDMFRMPASNGNVESPTNTHCPIITAVTHWAGSNVSLVIMLLEVSQWSWNEDNGAAGNFYTLLSRGSYFVVSV
jgi:hypothetical protein